MDVALLGDGLVLDEIRPLSFTEGPLASGGDLARLNADNLQLLIAEASLEEARANEALNEESPALLHELQRIESKLNILLRMMAELTVRQVAMPQMQHIRLSAQALEWIGDGPAAGSSGLIRLYVNPSIPQPLLLPAQVEARIVRDDAQVSQLRFVGIGEPVAEALEKMIFRHHRRLIAGSRHRNLKGFP